MDEDTARYAPVTPQKAALGACCPRCGQGKLFDGLTKLKPRCSSCGLDYSFADTGDGASIFVILIADFLVVGLAVWSEITYSPPVWLHILLWGPLAIGLSLWLLRTIKALLIFQVYHHNAKPGTIDHG